MDNEPSREMIVLALVLLVALVFLAYWPGLDGGYVFDDLPNIVQNTELHVSSGAWRDWLTAIFSSPSSRLQRPLAMLTFAINHFFTGLDPWPMKLTNIGIHALNGLLAFGLARSLLGATSLPGELPAGRRQLAALFTGFAWALHPINLMAVLFVVQRMESLCHVFVFAGLWLYASGRKRQLTGGRGWGRILLALLPFTILGTLAKESAVLLPLYALCMELCLYRFDAVEPGVRQRLQWMYALGLVLPALAGIAWLLPDSLAPGAFSNRSFSLAERLLSESRVLMDYLRWSIYPDLTQLSLYHDDFPVSHGWLDPPTTALSIAGISGLLALAWWLKRRRPITALAIFWFFAAQSLTATFIPLELMFEHRNYFASFGVCLLMADLLLLAPRTLAWRKAGAALALGLVLLYAAGTWLRAREWDHPVRFVQSEVAKHPLSPRATYELARMLVFLSNSDPDSPHLPSAMAAIEAARRVPGSNVLPDQAALIVGARTGQPLRDEWWTGLVWKFQHQPVGQQQMGALAALINCANSRLCHFPPDRMIEVISAAMIHGEQPELFNLYGSYALNSLHDPRLALALWSEAVRTAPSEPQYHINLTRLQIALGHREEARAEIAALRRIGRLGQYESLALKLEAALDAPSRPAPPADRSANPK